VKDDEKKAFLEDDTPVVAMDDIDGDALDIEAADTYTVPLTNTVGDVMA
jgi:hypothetical protein